MLTDGLNPKSLIEILGLESLPVEAQTKIVETAGEVLEMRILNRILNTLNEDEKDALTALLEAKNQDGIIAFMKEKGIDMMGILQEEIQKFKKETLEKFAPK